MKIERDNASANSSNSEQRGNLASQPYSPINKDDVGFDTPVEEEWLPEEIGVPFGETLPPSRKDNLNTIIGKDKHM